MGYQSGRPRLPRQGEMSAPPCQWNSHSKFRAKSSDNGQSCVGRPSDSVRVGHRVEFFELLLDEQVSGAAKHRISGSSNLPPGIMINQCLGQCFRPAERCVDRDQHRVLSDTYAARNDNCGCSFTSA